MASLDLGVHEFKPEDFLKLVQQHDDFTIVWARNLICRSMCLQSGFSWARPLVGRIT